MTTLYKYMPFRSSFFDDPLLRLTPPSELNDPFDSKPTQTGIEKKLKFLFEDQDEADNSGIDPQDIRATYEDSLKKGLDQFGIVSLTEDPYNLLMWSHYANEHRGLVISISCNSSTFDLHDKFTEKCGISKITPMKVSYSNRRPGHEMPDSTIYEYFEHNFHSHFAMTKGNDWIYEKEYRYLLRLTEADAAIVDINSTDWASSQGNDIRATHLHNNTYKVEASCDERRDILPWVIAFSQGKREISNVKLFKRLTPNSITGIYFGSRVSEEDIVKARKRIEENPLFGHPPSFYRSIESQDRFEIDFERLR
tara:strand:- start:2464 stop:3390 length:927 start_codon:yes stop_codon:yes gene_type:complete